MSHIGDWPLLVGGCGSEQLTLTGLTTNGSDNVGILFLFNLDIGRPYLGSFQGPTAATGAAAASALVALPSTTDNTALVLIA